MTARSLVLVSVAGLVLAACGGAAPPAASAPSTPAEPEPLSIEEAQAQISRASDELGGGSLPKTAPADAAPSSVSPAADAPAPPPPAPSKESSQEKKDIDVCATPCRALASMRRAVDALCRMAGDTDKRCLDARQTLADNVTRTASCSCSR